eukprot:Tbor_TRINITY_DN4116_c0_g1::TRINITY_DN4116_c0_g1_i1::g.26523::m.26523
MSLVPASELLTWVNTLRCSRDTNTDTTPFIRYTTLKEIQSRDIAQIALHTVNAQLSGSSSDNHVNHTLQTRFVFDPDSSTSTSISGNISDAQEDAAIARRNLRAIPSLLVEHNLLVLSSDPSSLTERLSNKEEGALIYVLSALYHRRGVVFKPTYNWTAHRRKLIEREVLPDGQPTSWTGGGVKSLGTKHKQELGAHLWNDPHKSLHMGPKEAQVILLQRKQLQCLKTSLACAFSYLPYFAANAADYEFVYGGRTMVTSHTPDCSSYLENEISTREKRPRQEDGVANEDEMNLSKLSKLGNRNENCGGFRQEMQLSQSQQDYAWKCIIEGVGGF